MPSGKNFQIDNVDLEEPGCIGGFLFQVYIPDNGILLEITARMIGYDAVLNAYYVAVFVHKLPSLSLGWNL